ncbi:MAG: hypothetical protein NC124_18685, partial [Clostridium sp.]|nr:hypothetical protein [Clostridium sp.]
QAFKFLNENATEEEFDKLANNLHRLESIITSDIKDVFNKKDSFLFLTLFDKFTSLGEDDVRFAEFLREFKNTLRNSERNENGTLFDEIDEGAGTKDKPVIIDKINLLEKAMLKFLHVDDHEDILVADEVGFVANVLDMDIEAIKSDIVFYNESLKDLTSRTVKDGSKLLHDENHPSLLAMVIYSYKEDVDLDEWLTEYAAKYNTYFLNQKKNFLHMKQNYEQWQREDRKSA